MKKFFLLIIYMCLFFFNWTVYCKSLPVIIIDPGHGGNDFGIKGFNNILEKDITLFIAQKISNNLSEKYKVILTRTGDDNISIMDRQSIANQNDGDLFISIHAGGSYNPVHYGLSIFYWDDVLENNINDIDSLEFNNNNNKNDWYNLQRIHIESSIYIAEVLNNNLVKSNINSKVKKGPFLILSGVDIPSLLIEIGFLSHPSEIKKIQESNFINVLSEELMYSIEKLIQKNEKDALQDLHFILDHDKY